MRQRRWIELLSDYECEIMNPTQARQMLWVDYLCRKERLKQRRVRAMSITIHLDLRLRFGKHMAKIFSTSGLRIRLYYDLRDCIGGHSMKREIASTLAERLTCSMIKAEHLLPKSSSGHDTIWVIVDRLTKLAHFLHIREDYKTEKLAKIYTNEIVARHGVPVSIHSDRDVIHGITYGKIFRAFVLDGGLSAELHQRAKLYPRDKFHVSKPQKCLAEPDVQVPLDEIEIDKNLRFVEDPIKIVERDVF
ncbi:putative reverse transcriptase domain-containing protein [Tanacetum coccineum]|uniref:Reverse transcriptase domain-containing protein n=1 Tax=Tanacetum coccineum TaxID=301880 RepID=A0ABQ5ACP8_9ASTR